MFNEEPLIIKEICDAYKCTSIQLRSALEKNHVREIVLEQIQYEKE